MIRSAAGPSFSGATEGSTRRKVSATWHSRSMRTRPVYATLGLLGSLYRPAHIAKPKRDCIRAWGNSVWQKDDFRRRVDCRISGARYLYHSRSKANQVLALSSDHSLTRSHLSVFNGSKSMHYRRNSKMKLHFRYANNWNQRLEGISAARYGFGFRCTPESGQTSQPGFCHKRDFRAAREYCPGTAAL